MKIRKPTKKELPLVWDGFMVYLAVVNVGLILFDWTYPLLRDFYQRHVPGLVELYDPWHQKFWLLDLPFLALFAVEFGVRWFLAIRKDLYRRWFVFPLVNWFDLLGIVPLAGFRFFRLFRLMSIYARLHRSDLSGVGQDPLSRGLSYLADVATEEISDRVAVRILGMAEREVESGVLPRILQQVLVPRRDEVRDKLVSKVVEVVSNPELKERGRKLLKLNLERSLSEVTVLKALPVPKGMLQPLVQVVGQAVYLSVAQTLTATLESPEGRDALGDLVDEVMVSFEEELGRGEIELLLEEAVLDAIAEMKQGLEVSRWAVADEGAE